MPTPSDRAPAAPAAALNAAAAAAIAALVTDFQPTVAVGFDGFVDSIIDVVATRRGPTEYSRIPTITELGGRISGAAGQSANLELVVRQTKIGGNGPIMANALAVQGAQVRAIGLLGEGDALHPAFQILADRAERVVSLGPPATTDALEFADGKVMLGKLQPLERLSWQGLVDAAGGLDGLEILFAPTAAIAATNWTMSLQMTDIWRHLLAEILPRLPQPAGGRRLFFVDLADPAKRPVAELREALTVLSGLQTQVDVVLGMNGSERDQVCAALGLTPSREGSEWDASAADCVAIRDRLGLAWTMCHLVGSAAVAWSEAARPGRPAGSAGANGFFTAKPLITTGAGDHFNAGFLHALLAGIDPGLAIQCGGATSGHYVRTGESPTRAQVAAFLVGG
ncbi:hypothetical protein LBMAG53_05420 [Planctomycetota bacterium]|nr:hypothetical protein LBMAG53_05420 [Planctomycetota bacterium]